VSHKHASVDEIGAASADSQRLAVESLLGQDAVEEAIVLQTCNRTEGYVVAESPADGRAALGQFQEPVAADSVVVLGHEESLRHLMRVAAGLESLVIGEDQILGQLRTAYEDARAVGAIGPMLEAGVTKAIHVGERARTETEINDGIVSLGSAAVRYARSELDLGDATGLVVGAGDMGSLVAGALCDAVDRLLVANRTVAHAEHVVDSVDGNAAAIDLDSLPAAVDCADVIISTTGCSDPLLDPALFVDTDATLVVDIAQPRDVDPAVTDLDHVHVCDYDELESVTAETHDRRAAAAEAVEGMIDREFEHLLTQYKRKRADQVIAAMYESADQIKQSELRTAFEKLDELDDDQREVVESMADALVGQLLAPPTKSLRDAAENDDWTTIHTALQLFDPEFGSDADAGAMPGLDSLPDEMPEGGMPAEVEGLGND
jgi:glutamyl-tRNA reductase